MNSPDFTPVKSEEPIQPETPIQTMPQAPDKKNQGLIIVLLILILLALLTAIGLLVYNLTNQVKAPDITPTPSVQISQTPTTAITTLPTIVTTTPTVTGEKMTLKFYVFDSQKDPEVMDCNAPSYVSRELPKSSTPLADGINYLMHNLKLTAAEKQAGLNNYFEDDNYIDRLDTLSLKSASIVNKLATLTFEDPKFFTSGGSCRIGILSAQIAGTAKQFPTVTDVKFAPENIVFQP